MASVQKIAVSDGCFSPYLFRKKTVFPQVSQVVFTGFASVLCNFERNIFNLHSVFNCLDKYLIYKFIKVLCRVRFVRKNE